MPYVNTAGSAGGSQAGAHSERIRGTRPRRCCAASETEPYRAAAYPSAISMQKRLRISMLTSAARADNDASRRTRSSFQSSTCASLSSRGVARLGGWGAGDALVVTTKLGGPSEGDFVSRATTTDPALPSLIVHSLGEAMGGQRQAPAKPADFLACSGLGDPALA